MDKQCSVDSCLKKSFAKNLCIGHHKRWWKNGDVQADIPINAKVKLGGICLVSNCVNKPKSKNLCNAHYNRLRTKGNVLANKPIKHIRYDYAEECLVEDCTLLKRKLGRCEKHYLRFRISGTDIRPEKCEVCKLSCSTRYDHDHATGKFRGWLCNRCNILLGMVDDNPEILLKLAEYLKV